MQYRTLGRTGVQVRTLSPLSGSSTFPAYRIVEGQWAARERHLGRCVTEQLNYSILNRGATNDVLPVTQSHGLGVPVWSPLSSGWLSGAVRDGQEITTHRAAEAGLTAIQLALGFVTSHPGVASAIIGPRTMDHLRSQLAAADTVLPSDVLEALDAVVAPGLDLSPEEKVDTRPSIADASLRRR